MLASSSGPLSIPIHLAAASALFLALGGAAAASSAESREKKPFLLYTELEVTATYSYEGNDPEPTPAFLQSLRTEAAQTAAAACTALLGQDTELQRTGEDGLNYSILRISLPTTWFCGRSITTTATVVPSLITAFESAFDAGQHPEPNTGLSGSANLDTAASYLLVKAGGPAISAMLPIIRNRHLDPDLRREFVRVLGRFTAGESSDLTSEEYLSLFPGLAGAIADPDNMLAYEAETAFAHYYGSATQALAVKDSLSEERYAELLYAISQQYNLNSSYAVSFGEIEQVLASADSLTVEFALAAARARTLRPEEFTALLPRLGELADPRSDIRSTGALQILADHPSSVVVPYLVKAIDPALLGVNRTEAFLFEAMKALRAVAHLPGASLALPALQQIAASTVNPDNHYLQNIASELITSINSAH